MPELSYARVLGCPDARASHAAEAAMKNKPIATLFRAAEAFWGSARRTGRAHRAAEREWESRPTPLPRAGASPAEMARALPEPPKERGAGAHRAVATAALSAACFIGLVAAPLGLGLAERQSALGWILDNDAQGLLAHPLWARSMPIADLTPWLGPWDKKGPAVGVFCSNNADLLRVRAELLGNRAAQRAAQMGSVRPGQPGFAASRFAQADARAQALRWGQIASSLAKGSGPLGDDRGLAEPDADLERDAAALVACANPSLRPLAAGAMAAMGAEEGPGSLPQAAYARLDRRWGDIRQATRDRLRLATLSVELAEQKKSEKSGSEGAQAELTAPQAKAFAAAAERLRLSAAPRSGNQWFEAWIAGLLHLMAFALGSLVLGAMAVGASKAGLAVGRALRERFGERLGVKMSAAEESAWEEAESLIERLLAKSKRSESGEQKPASDERGEEPQG